MMRFLVVVLFLFCVSGLEAQIVNIENRRIYDDTSGWSGNIAGGFSLTQNGPLFYTYNLRPQVQYKTRKHYYLFLSDLVYTRGNKQTYANSGMSHFRYAYRIKNGPWKWESYAQIQYNELLDQRSRSLVGTGIRWKFVDTLNVRFFAGTSTFYEYEVVRTDGQINQGLRWSNYLSWFINSKKGVSFTGITYYQPLWERFSDFRFSGQYSLSVSVTKRIDLRFEFNMYYDSKPPPNVRSMVFGSTAGFRFKLGE